MRPIYEKKQFFDTFLMLCARKIRNLAKYVEIQSFYCCYYETKEKLSIHTGYSLTKQTEQKTFLWIKFKTLSSGNTHDRRLSEREGRKTSEE